MGAYDYYEKGILTHVREYLRGGRTVREHVRGAGPAALAYADLPRDGLRELQKSDRAEFQKRSTELPREQQLAALEYSKIAYRDWNRALRRAHEGAIYSGELHQLQAAIEASKAPGPLVVYRGLLTKRPERIEELTGTEFTDRGFVSTSADLRTAQVFSGLSKTRPGTTADHTAVLMAIHVKEGQAALDVSAISRYSHESEVLLPAGTRFRVMSVEKLKPKRPTSKEAYVVNAEVVDHKSPLGGRKALKARRQPPATSRFVVDLDDLELHDAARASGDVE